MKFESAAPGELIISIESIDVVLNPHISSMTLIHHLSGLLYAIATTLFTTNFKFPRTPFHIYLPTYQRSANNLNIPTMKSKNPVHLCQKCLGEVMAFYRPLFASLHGKDGPTVFKQCSQITLQFGTNSRNENRHHDNSDPISQDPTANEVVEDHGDDGKDPCNWQYVPATDNGRLDACTINR